MKTEHENSFILSACKIMKEMCMLDITAGEAVLKKCEYLADSSLVMIGFGSDQDSDKHLLSIPFSSEIGNLSTDVFLNV